MSRRDSGPKRRAERYAEAAKIHDGRTTRELCVDAYMAGYRSAGRARRDTLVASAPSPSHLGKLSPAGHAALLAHVAAQTARIAELEERLRRAGM